MATTINELLADFLYWILGTFMTQPWEGGSHWQNVYWTVKNASLPGDHRVWNLFVPPTMAYNPTTSRKLLKKSRNQNIFSYLKWLGLSDKVPFQRYIICWGDFSLSKIIGGGEGHPTPPHPFILQNFVYSVAYHDQTFNHDIKHKIHIST